MKKWIALLVLAVILMIGYVAAVPFLTVNAIRNAVQSNNTAALSRHVDFVAVRRSLKAQVDEPYCGDIAPTLCQLPNRCTGDPAARVATPDKPHAANSAFRVGLDPPPWRKLGASLARSLCA